jgi:hypothetical protein
MINIKNKTEIFNIKTLLVIIITSVLIVNYFELHIDYMDMFLDSLLITLLLLAMEGYVMMVN